LFIIKIHEMFKVGQIRLAIERSKVIEFQLRNKQNKMSCCVIGYFYKF